MRMNKLLATLILLLALAAPFAQAQLMPTEKLDGIVAVLDGDVILRSELERQVATVQAQYANNPQQLPPRSELERRVLDRLIMSKLQVARADETGIRIADSEIDQTLGQIAAQNRMDVDQLRQAITRQGMSWEQFRHNVHDESLIQKLRQRVVQSRVQSAIPRSNCCSRMAASSAASCTRATSRSPCLMAQARNRSLLPRPRPRTSPGRSGTAWISQPRPSAIPMRRTRWMVAISAGAATTNCRRHLPRLPRSCRSGRAHRRYAAPNGFHIIKLIERREATSDLVTGYHARHILVRITEIVSAAQAERPSATCARILAGEDFAKLAKEFSNDTGTANLGGDMGWFVKGAYGSKIAGNADRDQGRRNQRTLPPATPAGTSPEPLATRTEDKTAEAERDKARQTLGSRKAEEEYGNFLRQIRAEAYIEIRLPGAAGASGSGS
ncbi:MAG: SurA N-terminal domain-containing protein [Xanthomonadales bacterium]|nr:SurA N-terminal domain-containing protein [Xanthomonadales bacterium]